MTARLFLLAALVAALVLVVRWRLFDQEAPPPPAEAARPGYYLTGVDLEEFGSDGRLRIGLQSVAAQEDPANGIVRLSEVAVDYHADDGQDWRLTATEARVPKESDVVEFEGNVHLSGIAAAQGEAAELRTDRLTLDTETEHAQTASPVELAFGRHLMQANGMHADLKAGRLRLESDVNGTFAP